VGFTPPCVRKTYVGNHGERKLSKELRIIHTVHFLSIYGATYSLCDTLFVTYINYYMFRQQSAIISMSLQQNYFSQHANWHTFVILTLWGWHFAAVTYSTWYIGPKTWCMLKQTPKQYMYVSIGFKTSLYFVRHLDSTASYLPTGLHLGFFRSWPSLSLPTSFFFGLPRALFCFDIHFNAILGNLPSAILWTWPYHVSWFCSISFIIGSSNPKHCTMLNQIAAFTKILDGSIR